jgi:arsenate reductase
MAEGILRALYDDCYEAYSAGTQLAKVNPYAIKVMSEIGIDISHHRSKSVGEFLGTKFDYVVTVCNNAKETCPFFPTSGKRYLYKGFTNLSDFEN